MTSTFHGLEVARRGLNVQQKAISTTGHNISNANTEGYTRQKVNMSATNAMEVPGMTRSQMVGQLGTGVSVTSIERIRERFLDDQFRNEAQSFSEWNVRKDTLEKIELLFDEPSDSGFRSVIDEFWNAWQDLSQEPDNLTARAVVKERSLALVDVFQHTDKKLTELDEDLENRINMKSNEANIYIDQIAGLNDEIRRIEGLGNKANDLRDQRDSIVDKLAEIASVKVVETNGMYNVSTIVENVAYDPMDPASQEFVDQLLVNGLETTLIGEDTDDISSDLIAGGEIQGLNHSRDDIVVGYRAHLDEMLKGLVTKDVEIEIPAGSVLADDVTDTDGNFYAQGTEIPDDITAVVEGINGLHQLGWTMREDGAGDAIGGAALFTLKEGTDFDADFSIANIQFNPDIAQDVSLMASSMRVEVNADGETKVLRGNGALALAMGKLRDGEFDFDSAIASSGQGTFEEYFRSVMGELGVQAQEANRQTNNLKSIMDAVDNRRESVSGVSLDEEMANLIQFQHAYNASARVITSVDQMLDTIINRMGVVGR